MRILIFLFRIPDCLFQLCFILLFLLDYRPRFFLRFGLIGKPVLQVLNLPLYARTFLLLYFGFCAAVALLIFLLFFLVF